MFSLGYRFLVYKLITLDCYPWNSYLSWRDAEGEGSNGVGGGGWALKVPGLILAEMKRNPMS